MWKPLNLVILDVMWILFRFHTWIKVLLDDLETELTNPKSTLTPLVGSYKQVSKYWLCWPKSTHVLTQTTNTSIKGVGIYQIMMIYSEITQSRIQLLLGIWRGHERKEQPSINSFFASGEKGLAMPELSWEKSFSESVVRDVPNQFTDYAVFLTLSKKGWGSDSNQTLPKAQRTRGLSSSCQSNLLRSHHKFKHKSHHILSSESRLSINSKFQPNISISTKLKIQNLGQT